jgi:hypothetical protein
VSIISSATCTLSAVGFPDDHSDERTIRYEPDIVQLFTVCRSRQQSGHSGGAMKIVQGLKMDSVSAILVLLLNHEREVRV